MFQDHFDNLELNGDVMKRFLDYYEKRTIDGRLHIGPETTYYRHHQPTPLVYDITQDPSRESIRITYDEPKDLKYCIPQHRSSIGTSVKPKQYQYMFLENFIHNFTFELFCDDTDSKLKAHYPLINDGHDNNTPDLIMRTPSSLLVIEFTTNRTDNDSSLLRAYNLKVQKYEEMLRNRVIDDSYTTHFVVIVVGVTKIVTNLISPPQQLIDELCYRFQMARLMNDTLIQMGLTRPQSEESSMSEKHISTLFSSINLTFDDDVFTEEFYYSCLRNTNHREVEQIKRKIVREASDEIRGKAMENGRLRPYQIAMEQQKTKFDKLLADFNQEADSRETRSAYDKSSIIPIPFINVSCEKETSRPVLNHTEFPLYLFKGDNPYLRLFKEVLESAYQGNVDLPLEDESIMYEEAIQEHSTLLDGEKEKEKNIHRSQNFRVKIDPSESDRAEFAKLGVEGLKYHKEMPIKEYREEKKKKYDYRHDTSDISKLIQDSGELYYRNGVSLTIDFLLYKELIASAIDMHKQEDFRSGEECLSLFLNSRMGAFCSLVSDIGFELSLSLRQNVKPGHFLVKKLRTKDVYIIIKPTNSSSHIFFSLLMENSSITYHNNSSVFKTLHTNGKVCWTEFQSFNVSKLVNLAKCDSISYCCLAFCHEQFRLDMEKNLSEIVIDKRFVDYDPSLKNDSPVTKQHLFLMMVLLHDKHQVEEVITDYRYTFMEGFVEFPFYPNPVKMMEKLSPTCRSRLHCYVTKQHVLAIERIITSAKVDYSRGESGEDKWTGIFDPWTGIECSDPQQVINVLYFGYLKNKEESAERNVSSRLYTKILTYEDKMKEVNRDYLGKKNPMQPKFHEFSHDLLKATTDKYGGFIKGLYGEDWKLKISSEVFRNLSSQTVESLATFKASCGLNENHYEALPEGYHRPRVFQELCRKVDEKFEGMLAVDYLKSSLEKLEKRGSVMHIDLFQKAQHGGLREIYVLGIEERICQLVMERISRVLCALCPSETMTNPKNKINLLYTHNTLVKSKLGDDSMTFSCSADAQKWNQGHYITKFVMMLLRLTDRKLHGAIFRIGRLWLKKRIFLSQDIITMIRNTSEYTIEDPYFNRIRNCYYGDTKETWMESHKTYIQTESGMMQGILHYTSSLLHTILQEYLKSMFYSHIQNSLYTRLGLDQEEKRKCYITVMQSSDDSGMVISVETQSDEERVFSSITTAECFLMKENLGRYLGIWNSVKTTAGTTLVYEFNSEYYFRGYLYRPTFRWVAACCTLTEQENLTSRQEEMYSLVTSVLEGGGSLELVYNCQLGQSILHYRLFGMNINPCFAKYADMLLQTNDPSTGFFLLDNPLLAGLPGFAYNLWIACRNTNLGVKYKLLFNDLNIGQKVSEIEYKALTNTSNGTFVHGTCLSFGGRKRWERIVNQANLNKDYESFYDENPHALFLKPENLEELKSRLAMKIHSPGVVESLSKGNIVSRMVASSTYVISSDAISIKDEWKRVKGLKNEEELTSRKKTNLLKILLGDLKLVNKYQGILKMDSTMERYLFPMHEEYLSILDVLKGFSVKRIKPKFGAPKKVRSTVVVSEAEMQIASPEKIVSSFWLKRQWIPASQSTIHSMFETLKMRIPFLRNSFQDTLLASPFDHAHQLHNFFSRLELRSRIVRLTGAPVLNRGGLATLDNTIMHDYSPAYTLLHRGEICPDFEEHDDLMAPDPFRMILHSIACLKTIPIVPERKEEALLQILSHYPLKQSTTTYKSKRTVFNIMHKFHLGEYGSSYDRMLTEIMNCRLGIVGGFVKAQKYVRSNDGRGSYYSGEGIWMGKIDDLVIKIVMHSDERCSRANIQRMEVNKRDITGYLPAIKSLCQDINVTNLMERGYSRSCIAFMYNFSLDSDRGAPIFYEENLTFILNTELYENYGLSLNKQGGLSLRAKLSRTRSKYAKGTTDDIITLLSLTAHSQDVNKLLNFRSFPEMRSILKSWITQQSMPVESIIRIINKFDDVQKHFESDAPSWFWNQLVHKLKSLHIIDNTYSTLMVDIDDMVPEALPLNVDEVLEAYGREAVEREMNRDWSQIQKDLCIEPTIPISPEEKERDLQAEMIDAGFRIGDVNMDHEAAMGATKIDFLKYFAQTHPLLDDYAYYVTEMFPNKASLKDFFQNKFVRSNCKEFCTDLIKKFQLCIDDYKIAEDLVLRPPTISSVDDLI
ncbi:RNA-dependent RNA polymerase [Aphis citricidus bunyavirus]|uniref:RNA-directed RNA polymerase L n=1 Tax=Aphis citricidus bunyavirus TaxID=2599343 RepID=A0A5B8HBW2_9VIRU|nr:RNA-dependent RNA polymerase [Aphis citricidus bunyavirus]QDW80893.1 RNA-dependent RNA polymerase [Aphis citricidus bunyavirus]